MSGDFGTYSNLLCDLALAGGGRALPDFCQVVWRPRLPIRPLRIPKGARLLITGQRWEFQPPERPPLILLAQRNGSASLLPTMWPPLTTGGWGGSHPWAKVKVLTLQEVPFVRVVGMEGPPGSCQMGWRSRIPTRSPLTLRESGEVS